MAPTKPSLAIRPNRSKTKRATEMSRSRASGLKAATVACSISTERPGGFGGAIPVCIAPVPQLIHDVSNGNEFAAWERMCTRYFEGVPDNHDVNHAINIYRVALQVRFTVPRLR
jgi:hypothetical protein